MAVRFAELMSEMRVDNSSYKQMRLKNVGAWLKG